MLLAYSCLNICRTVCQIYCSLFRRFLFMKRSTQNCQNSQLSTFQMGHMQCSIMTTGGSTAATRGNEGSRCDWSAPAQPSPCHLQASPRRVWACVHRKEVASVPETQSPTQVHRNRAPRVEFKEKKNSSNHQESVFIFLTTSSFKLHQPSRPTA